MEFLFLLTAESAQTTADFPWFDNKAGKPSRGTLRDLVAQLDEKTGSDFISVDDAIAGKPMCWFGIDVTKPTTVLRGAALLYGLAVRTTKEKHWIELIRSSEITVPTDIPAYVQRITPPPLARYFAHPEVLTEDKSPSRLRLYHAATAGRVMRAWNDRIAERKTLAVNSLDADTQTACALLLVRSLILNSNLRSFPYDMLVRVPDARIEFREGVNQSGFPVLNMQVWLTMPDGSRRVIYSMGMLPMR